MNIHRGLFRGNITKVSGSFIIIIIFFLINDEIFECIIERMYIVECLFIRRLCLRDVRERDEN